MKKIKRKNKLIRVIVYFLETCIAIKLKNYFGIFSFFILEFQIYIDISAELRREKENKKPENPNKKNEILKEKKIEMSQYAIERYAVMCNAYLEHEDEMEQYKNN